MRDDAHITPAQLNEWEEQENAKRAEGYGASDDRVRRLIAALRAARTEPTCSTADPITFAQLAELEALERAAAPAPWRSMAEGNQYIKTTYLPTAKCVPVARIDGIVRPWNPYALIAFGFKPSEYETARFLEADADFIAVLRNAAPDLFAALRAAWARIEELERGLEQVRDNGTEHGGHCAGRCSVIAVNALEGVTNE